MWLEIGKKWPQNLGGITNELPSNLEVEKSYSILEAAEPDDVVRGVFEYMNGRDNRVVILPAAVRKEMAVVKYKKPVSFSTRRDLDNGVITVVAKGEKEKFWGGDGEVVIVRPEIKLVVPNGQDALVTARQRLLPAEFRGNLEPVDQYHRRKVTGLIVDKVRYLVFYLNVSQRIGASGETNCQAEVEHYGNMLYAPRGRATALEEVCNGVLRVSREVVKAGEELGYTFVPRNQSKGPLPSRRFN